MKLTVNDRRTARIVARAILLAVFPALLVALAILPSQSDNYVFALALGTSVMVNVFLFVRYSAAAATQREKVARENMRYGTILAELDALLRARTGLSSALFDLVSAKALPDDYKEMSSEFLAFALNAMKRIAEAYTGDSCSACLKVLVPEAPTSPNQEQHPVVATYLRDSTSKTERFQTDKELVRYELSDHTPFEQLVSVGSAGFFYSNDLQDGERQGTYKNSNPNYKKYYNATAVAPISNPGTLHNEDIVGFLCVDSPSGGFDDGNFRAAMQVVASTIFYVMRSTVVLEIALNEIHSVERASNDREHV